MAPREDRTDRFDAMWTSHSDAVFGYARRRADEEPARDALAETFATAWRRIDEVPADPLPWLLGVCRRVLANQRRGRLRRLRLHRRLASLAPEATAGTAESSIEAAAIRAAFLALEPAYREALALVAWDGLSPADAARVVGCSAGAFSTRLHRARRRLAEELDRVEGRTPRTQMEEAR
jgi:RNA polymerase sigma-70 factor (ECF subfamily)